MIPSARFNPKGWVCDEGSGMRGGIKQVFGDDAVKKTFSCEFHFKVSVDKFCGYLSKGYGPDFETSSMLSIRFPLFGVKGGLLKRPPPPPPNHYSL